MNPLDAEPSEAQKEEINALIARNSDTHINDFKAHASDRNRADPHHASNAS
jgi:hypothetical protein